MGSDSPSERNHQLCVYYIIAVLMFDLNDIQAIKPHLLIGEKCPAYLVYYYIDYKHTNDLKFPPASDKILWPLRIP